MAQKKPNNNKKETEVQDAKGGTAAGKNPQASGNTTSNNSKSGNWKNVNRGSRSGKPRNNSRSDRGSSTISFPLNNPDMVRDAANINYSWPVGDIIRQDKWSQSSINENFGSSIPGLMQFNYVPTYGAASTLQDPLNAAATNLFEVVMHANSRSSVPYDAVDLMMTNIVVDSIAQLFTLGSRVYGILNLFRFQNRYTPQVMFNTMGFDYNDWISHMPKFRYEMNVLANRFNSMIKVADKFEILKRHADLCANVYQGSDTDYAQLYWFMPTGWYNYSTEEVDGVEMPILKYITFKEAAGAELLTVDMFVGLIKSLIDNITTDSIFMQMGADILKAFGEEKLFKLSPIEDLYTIVPVSSDVRAMEMMKNFTAFDFSTIDGSHSITNIVGGDLTIRQSYNADYLVQNPDYTVTLTNPGDRNRYVDYLNQPILVTTERQPSPEVTMDIVSTVIAPKASNGTTSNDAVVHLTYGSLLPQNVDIVKFVRPGQTRKYTRFTNKYVGDITTDWIVDTLQILGDATVFKYAPRYNLCFELAADDNSAWVSGFYNTSDNLDVDVYALITAIDAERMHYSEILNCFDLSV